MAATLTIIDKVVCSLFIWDPDTKELITPIIPLDGQSTFISTYQDQGNHLYQGCDSAACEIKLITENLINPFL